MAVSPFVSSIDVVDTVSPCIDAEEHGAVSIDAKHHPAIANCEGSANNAEIAVNLVQLGADRVRMRVSAGIGRRSKRPYAQRRCRVMYELRTIQCRQCHGGWYSSQAESRAARATRAMFKIVQRLDRRRRSTTCRPNRAACTGARMTG